MVTVGLTYNGLAEIKTGLKEGDKIITSGYIDLNEGESLSLETSVAGSQSSAKK